ncbi:MAG TPA: response regulator [Bryobacteraceae bacterium]|nr:response regulator [Bryobacteraceae bacterium]
MLQDRQPHPPLVRHMETSMGPKSTPSRQELEDIWRSNLEQAQIRYRAATARYSDLLKEASEGVPPSPDSPLACARHAQSEALAAYTRVLQVFSELAVHGKRPEEQLKPDLVAVIDDDKSVRNSIKTLLRSAGYRVETFESAETFLESGMAIQTGCLILDIRLPGMDGLELQVRLQDRDSHLPIIFITGHADGSLRQRVLQAGAVEMLQKPFAPNSLLSALETALDGEAQ